MSSELDNIDDFFLAHSVDDNKDLAFGSDGEDSDYNPDLDEKVFSDMDTDSDPEPPPSHQNTSTPIIWDFRGTIHERIKIT